jgi:hypothetical protein
VRRYPSRLPGMSSGPVSRSNPSERATPVS